MAVWEKGWYQSGDMSNMTWFKEKLPMSDFSNLQRTLDNLIKGFEKVTDVWIGDVLSNLGEVSSNGAFLKNVSQL